MQLIPEGWTGFLEQVSPSPPPSCQQPRPPWPLNKPGPFRMSPEGHRTTLRAWEGHGCCQGLPTLADNTPSEANLLQVKTIQSAPPGVHWDSSFGMSEARRLKGRREVNNAKGGTRTSCQGSWPAALGTNTPSDLTFRKGEVPAGGRKRSPSPQLPSIFCSPGPWPGP